MSGSHGLQTCSGWNFEVRTDHYESRPHGRLQDWAAANGWWLYAPEPNQAAAEALLARKSVFDVVEKGLTLRVRHQGPPCPPSSTEELTATRGPAANQS